MPRQISVSVLSAFEPGEFIPELHHFPDNHQRGRLYLLTSNTLGEVSQRSGKYALIDGSALLHKGRRRISGPTMGY